MYIQLEVGWMHHPFSVNSFRIATSAQLQAVQALGLETVRYVPARSEPVAEDAAQSAAADASVASQPAALPPGGTAADLFAAPLAPQLWQRCNQRFHAATHDYEQLYASAASQPLQAFAQSRSMVDGYLQDLLPAGELVIRLLSQSAGSRQAEHPVNVTVLSLLLGRTLGLGAAPLHELGMAALLHDIGKDCAPGCVVPSAAEHESHVGQSVARAMAMGVSSDVLTAMAQHHEFADGSGFPLHLIDEDLGLAGKVLSLVNSYDRLCNPEFGQAGQTPHDALSLLYAQFKARFDPAILRAFIRMLGVYPPGSLVQLSDGRIAMVVSVNCSRPLKPLVLVHDPLVPLAQAQPLDLEACLGLGIRRSLRPDQLARETLSYLLPGQRICYFFEPAVEPASVEVCAP